MPTANTGRVKTGMTDAGRICLVMHEAKRPLFFREIDALLRCRHDVALSLDEIQQIVRSRPDLFHLAEPGRYGLVPKQAANWRTIKSKMSVSEMTAEVLRSRRISPATALSIDEITQLVKNRRGFGHADWPDDIRACVAAELSRGLKRKPPRYVRVDRGVYRLVPGQ